MSCSLWDLSSWFVSSFYSILSQHFSLFQDFSFLLFLLLSLEQFHAISPLVSPSSIYRSDQFHVISPSLTTMQRHIISASNHVDIAVTISNFSFSLCHLACDKFEILAHWLLQAEPKVNNLCINLCLLINYFIWCRTALLLLKQPWLGEVP